MQLLALIPKKFKDSITVVQCRRKWILGSEPIFNAHDNALSIEGILRALKLVGIAIPAEESTAMQIQQHR
jgi:hypothetical protein